MVWRTAVAILHSLLLLEVATAADGGPSVVKLAHDGSGGTPITDYSIANFKIRAATYPIEGAAVGYSWVDGPQYEITTPEAAEVLHAIQGEVTYVDKDGRLYTVRPGDVLFVAGGSPYTGRDGKDYAHHYVVFPLEPFDQAKSPQMRMLRASELSQEDFQSGPNGEEHVYFRGEDGIQVAAWRFPTTGSIQNASLSRWIAITAGTGEIKADGVTTSVKAGDTILVRKGASYAWSGSDLQGIYVSF